MQNNAMPTPAVSNPPNGRFSLTFTLVPLILYGLADLFPIPYLRISYFDLFTNTSEKHNIVSLGIAPWLIAAGVVEFAAFIVPPWSALRHDESIGRAKLRLAVNIIGIFFAACGAYWIAFSLDRWVSGVEIASAPSWEFYVPFHQPRLIPSPNRAFVSLMAGAIFVKILADIVARRGLIHGFALFIAVTKLPDTAHGTFVAGIIGAEGNNGPGSQGFGIAGALWRVQILPIRIDNPAGNGGTSTTQAMVEAMMYASRMGAHIANLSFGSLQVSDAADTRCLRDLKGLLQGNAAGIPAATFPGAAQAQANIFRQVDLAPGGNVVTKTLFVMSAGNDTANLADPQVFSFAESAQTTLGKNVLVVGASESNEATMADFSNYGAPVVEIFAPGTDWKSLKPWVTGQHCAPADDEDCVEYGSLGFRPHGTSYAAPLVAGIAGLALIAFPSLRGDPIALHDHLVRTATPVVSETIECSPQQDQPLVNAHAVVTTTP